MDFSQVSGRCADRARQQRDGGHIWAFHADEVSKLELILNMVWTLIRTSWNKSDVFNTAIGSGMHVIKESDKRFRIKHDCLQPQL